MHPFRQLPRCNSGRSPRSQRAGQARRTAGLGGNACRSRRPRYASRTPKARRTEPPIKKTHTHAKQEGTRQADPPAHSGRGQYQGPAEKAESNRTSSTAPAAANPTPETRTTRRAAGERWRDITRPSLKGILVRSLTLRRSGQGAKFNPRHKSTRLKDGRISRDDCRLQHSLHLPPTTGRLHRPFYPPRLVVK